MEENSPDSRSECRGRQKLHSIISKISGSVSNGFETEQMGDESESDGGFELLSAECGNLKRKSDRKGDARKLMKDSDGEPLEVQVQEQDLSSSQEVQVFTDLPSDNPFSIEEPNTSLYSDIHLQDLQHQEELEDSEDSEVMPQVALGLVPTKRQLPLSNTETQSLTYIPAHFVRKLEELESQVKVLQNKNQALEEFYKKLSDLVEAQNHLLTSASLAVKHVPASQSLPEVSQESAPDVNSGPPSCASNLHSVTTSTFSLRISRPRVSTGSYSYELPRRVSAKDVLHLWEHGNEDFPPLKDWTPTQKLKQQSKISRWKKLVDIFKNDYNGDINLFKESFSDTKGEILPITTILSLYETQQTPAYLKAITPSKYEPLSCPAGGADILPSPHEKEEADPSSDSKLLEAETLDYDESSIDPLEEHVPGTDKHSSAPDGNGDTSNTRFQLPRKVGPRDIVHLWNHGCDQFPPVSQWTRAQKIGQETKVFRWKKIVEIFNQDCDSDWTKFEEKFSNERGQSLAISAIIYKHDVENTPSGPVLERKYSDWQTTSDRGGVGEVSDDSCGHTDVVKVENLFQKESATMVPLQTREENREGGHAGTQLKSPLSPITSPLNSPGTFVLPRKVTAKDIIRMWEEGSGDMPPLCQWTPTQKAGQRSKFSRWAKIYDIYKYYCKGDMRDFEAKFSDERGELLPVTTIVAMYEARETTPGMPGTLPSMSRDRCSEAAEGEIFQLPRKVTAKEVVSLWEEGCEYFPPVSKWPKIHKVGHETKIFRWKKIVDIFRKDCSGSWEKFEKRFSNHRGELLPVSAILAKYDLENESALPYYRVPPSSMNGAVHEVRPETTPLLDRVKEDKTQVGKEDSGSDSSDEQCHQAERSAAFILPKKVSALDVIYFWENGLGDMPPVCQWSPAEKATQRSKVSRWSKIVDIFKYECGGDIRQFEEKYKDERGELMPITTILNLHDAHHSS